METKRGQNTTRRLTLEQGNNEQLNGKKGKKTAAHKKNKRKRIQGVH